MTLTDDEDLTKLIAARKSVRVKFVNDEDIVQHIVHLKERKRGGLPHMERTVSSGAKRQAVMINDQEVVLGSSDEEDEVYKSSRALVNDGVAGGKDLFTFRTPKKSNSMTQKALESKTPTTPKSKNSLQEFNRQYTALESKTPTTPKSKNSLQEFNRQYTGLQSRSPNTPKSRKPLSESNRHETGSLAMTLRKKSHKRPETTTPYRLRKRNHFAYNDESSSDSLYSSSDESDSSFEPQQKVLSNTADLTIKESNDSSKIKPTSEANTKISTPSASKKMPEEDMPSVVEQYFEVHSTKGLTSDRTLSRLDMPRIDLDDLQKLLKNVSGNHCKEYKQLFDKYPEYFDKWLFLLSYGFNILVYGFGSKKSLLEKFFSKKLNGYDHVIVNGFFPSLSIKHILDSITEEILNEEGTFKTLLDQCEFIKKSLEDDDRDFFLLIHNIDGIMLRSAKVQNIFSFLCKIKRFHMVASVDHINAPLIWDQMRYIRFNWLWCDVTTYEPYMEETAYENSLMVQQSGRLALSSLSHVMHSLTSNAKGIFMLLARYQMENQAGVQNYQGMSFHDLYLRCRESFLVNNDIALRSQLTEFRDHKLIKSKKAADGIEHLIIQLDTSTLKDYFETEEAL
ncbi:origin recognition complex subunit 2 isoform X2 [Octopus bimaculoides]|uniref:Origin recognition complex subunit 2 n=1 Tax=Octopus bimaculoides TaxID=37653 RepID=A0A0L8HKF4_OCTBM|nr:origin recognition complex subunit 2 isoform X2 [Octopus bimaculoides]